MNSEDLYMPLGKALVELERRQKNVALREKIDKYFASHPTLEPLDKEPRGVLARALFAPIYELDYFLEIEKQLTISSVFFEFTKDKFVTINSGKACLGEMIFFKEGQNGAKEVTGSERIVDFKANEGKPLVDVKTMHGDSIVDFHHRLLSKHLGGRELDIRDFSDWYLNSYSFSKELPYLRYLGLFMVHGILFENFVTKDKYQRPFTMNRVIPAAEKLYETFGVRPLIVPIDPISEEDAPFWTYFPDKLREYI